MKTDLLTISIEEQEAQELAEQQAAELAAQQAAEAPEEEITIYAKITDFSGLEQANSQQHHIQAEIQSDNGNRIRVRKTTIEGQEPIYEMTTKTNCSNDNGVSALLESTYGIDEDMFNSFVKVAGKYIDKTRYCFNIEGITVTDEEGEKSVDVGDLKYEVDVFKNGQGQVCQWCKIDIEVQKLPGLIENAGIDADQLKLRFNASKLPFSPEEFILTGDDSTSEEDKMKVKELFQNEFQIQVTDQPEANADEEVAPELEDGSADTEQSPEAEVQPESETETETPASETE